MSSNTADTKRSGRRNFFSQLVDYGVIQVNSFSFRGMSKISCRVGAGGHGTEYAHIESNAFFVVKPCNLHFVKNVFMNSTVA